MWQGIGTPNSEDIREDISMTTSSASRAQLRSFVWKVKTPIHNLKAIGIKEKYLTQQQPSRRGGRQSLPNTILSVSPPTGKSQPQVKGRGVGDADAGGAPLVLNTGKKPRERRLPYIRPNAIFSPGFTKALPSPILAASRTSMIHGR